VVKKNDGQVGKRGGAKRKKVMRWGKKKKNNWESGGPPLNFFSGVVHQCEMLGKGEEKKDLKKDGGGRGKGLQGTQSPVEGERNREKGKKKNPNERDPSHKNTNELGKEGAPEIPTWGCPLKKKGSKRNSLKKGRGSKGLQNT